MFFIYIKKIGKPIIEDFMSNENSKIKLLKLGLTHGFGKNYK